MKKNIFKRYFSLLIASLLVWSGLPIPIVYAADINLQNWKITLPICDGDEAKEVRQPELNTLSNEWFKKTSEGLNFYVNSKGACTTGGSENPRSELREMNTDGSKEYNWDPSKGTHRMIIRQKVTELNVKGDSAGVVIGQIHDVGKDIDDYTVFRLEGKTLYAFVDGKKSKSKVIDKNFPLNQEISLGFSVENNTVKFLYDRNGGAQPSEVHSVPYPGGSDGAYFKAGNYCQCGKDGRSGSTRVVITGLGVTHDGSTPNIGEGGGLIGTSQSCGPSDFDEGFFSSNDILFYNTCDTNNVCEDTSNPLNSVIEGNDNAEKIFNFLISTPISTNGNKPLRPIQAAAMVGNFAQESQLDPEKTNSKGAVGLAQWLDSRKENLLKLSEPKSLETQLKFVIYELEKTPEKQLLSNADFKEGNDIEKTTLAVRKVYERPGETEANDSNRIAEAKRVLQKFGSNTPSSLTTISLDTASSSILCAGGGGSPFITDDGFTVYNQEDPAWASRPYGTFTIKEAGCGPSAMAAIITAFTGKRVTPVETAKYASDKGLVTSVGSSHTLPLVLAPNWNLTAKKISKNINTINTELRTGGLVILAGNGAAPFTPVGHYIVIRGVTKSGKWKIADSNGTIGQKNSTQEWDPNPILSNASAGSMYVIKK